MTSHQAAHRESYKLRGILIVLSLMTLAFGGLHYFIFSVITRTIENQAFVNSIKVVMTIGLFSMPAGFLLSRTHKASVRPITWFGYIWMGVFTIGLFFSTCEFILSFFYNHNYSEWVVACTLAISIWSLFKGLKDPTLKKYSLKIEKLKGLKLIQVSDLHVGLLHLNGAWLSRVVETINKNKPDIVAITGDLVEASYEHIHDDLEVLSKLSSIPNKFYITGNHEFIHGGGTIWEKKLESIGFKVLHNSHVELKTTTATIMVAGVPDKMAKRFSSHESSRPDLALKSENVFDYKILLAHQPTSVYDLKGQTCDLILSGHTHGGQIFPFHLLVRLVQPVLSGFKLINGSLVFAHSGTGLWGPPMRWFTTSEIALIEWN